MEMGLVFPWIVLLLVTYLGLAPPLMVYMDGKKMAARKKKHIIGEEFPEEEDSPIAPSPRRTEPPSKASVAFGKAVAAEEKKERKVEPDY